MDQSNVTWQNVLLLAIRLYLENATNGHASTSSIKDTPKRVVKAFTEYVAGCHQDPASFLTASFDEEYTGMVHVRRIPIASMCEHHLCPIIGLAHFAYIPDGKIVGLSKIPRMIRALSRRPQVQERLTRQIVDTFQDTVQPRGCAVHIQALHFCMIWRGVNIPDALTDTTELRGVFKDEPTTHQEFISSLRQESILL